jgi:hypothetical protein
MEEQKHLEGAGIEGAAERRKGKKGERERERSQGRSVDKGKSQQQGRKGKQRR